MRSMACFALLLSILAASCGGNVVVDTGSSGSSSLATCEAACNAVTTACPSTTTTNCTTSCQKLDPLFEKACPAAYEAYMTCAAAHPGAVCTVPMTACTAEAQAFSTCSSQVCNPVTICE